MARLASNNIPTIIVVFGATGDLMTKKVIPSLFKLFKEEKIPNRFEVIGFARRPLTDEQFRSHVIESAEARGIKGSREEFETFATFFHYNQGTFEDEAGYEALVKQLAAIDESWGQCSNKLFYLAVPPETFGTIFTHLATYSLNKPCGDNGLGWTRILVEKPFGSDRMSSDKLERLLERYFKEEQLYRIDHYLAKEIVQGILHFRFSNNLLESAWDNQTIEKIEVAFQETIGVEQRGAFYDAVGALRDVGQNHLLEMLAAITMDQPLSMDETELRAKRAAIIATLKPWTKDDLKANTFRAQYDGYQAIKGVAPDSTEETYFHVVTELTHPAWRGVPITLYGGKRFKSVRKEIVVTFKHPAVCLLCTAHGGHPQNKVVFTLEPEDRITIHFWTKKPGYDKVLEERTFTFFLYERVEKIQYVEEYSKLLHAAIKGDQTLFVNKDEVANAWAFVDPIITAWQKNLVPLTHYAPDTDSIVAEASRAVSAPRTLSLPKEIGLIGLGKMGANLARHLTSQGWKVVAYNRTAAVTEAIAKEGVVPSFSYNELVSKLPARKVVWLMVPAGKPVDEVLFGKDGLVKELKRGDIVIDGGNSFYKDADSRAKKLAKLGIAFIDVGTSGGPGGALHGACLMIGGDAKTFKLLEPLWQAASKDGSYQFFEGVGAGHFVKMVHNGIEYGMMQALAEGFAILKKAKFNLNLLDVASIYNNGSVIESRLVGWLERAFEVHGDALKDVSGTVAHTGEGAWTVETATVLKLKAAIIAGSLQFRKRSAKHPDYTGKILSALREQFGGHAIR